MSFFVINGNPIFLTQQRIAELEAQATKEWDVLDRVSMFVSGQDGDRLRADADKRMYQYLDSQMQLDPVRFRHEWIDFEFSGTEAVQNVKRLLHDYGLLYGHCWLKGVPLRQLLPEYNPVVDFIMGDNWWQPYPQERIFELVHEAAPRKWWWRFWPHRMKDRAVRLVFDSEEVVRITGSLRRFEVSGRSWTLLCDQHAVQLLALQLNAVKAAMEHEAQDWHRQTALRHED